MDELDRILQLLKKGDRRGLELLFHHFYKPLVFYAMNFLAQQEEAEDAVQEVFIKFWEGKRFHAIKNSLRPYLYQSVRNYCLNLLEGKKVVLTEPINSGMDMAENEYLDESEWNTRIDQLYKAVDRLPDRTREVFKRIVLDGKRHKEVAEEFEISVTTVKTLLARALAALRAELSEKTYSILLLFV